MKQQGQLTNLNNSEKLNIEADYSSIVHDAATNHDSEKLEFLINQNPGLIYAKD